MLKKMKNLLGRPVASYIEVLMAHHAIFPSLRRKDYVTSHTKKKIELEKYIVITTNKLLSFTVKWSNSFKKLLEDSCANTNIVGIYL